MATASFPIQDEPTAFQARSSALLSVFFVGLLLFSIFRVVLFLYRIEVPSEVSNLVLPMLGVGLRFDLAVMGLFCLPLLLLLLVSPDRWVPRISHGYAVLLLGGVALAELAGLSFFGYYDFRFNYLVLEHGADPEVLKTIANDFPVIPIVIGCILVTIVSHWIFRRLTRKLNNFPRTPVLRSYWLRRWLLPVLLIPLFVFAVRGSAGHRGINPSLAAFSPERVINEISGSGVFNLVYEIEQKFDKKYYALSTLYTLLPKDTALEESKVVLGGQGSFVPGAVNPLLREIQNPEGSGPSNVVLVVMESFTGRLVSSVGGEFDLAPEFDKLSEEGLLFTNCYATGERTIQGLEAIVASFPPLPGVSVVRRPEARTGFSTLGSVLGKRDYATHFYYGGDGLFDHMRGFFLSNGFQKFIEEKHFEDPHFVSPWGISDEDVFARANRDFQRLSNQGKPFFATILTVSLHSPWVYPENRITPLPDDFEVPKGFDYEELNNFIYADWAIGEFVREAKKLPYFHDTLFVFVGDHGVHLRGRNLIPSEEYIVPALFLAPKHISPQRIERVTSQLDLAPTIMGIVGGDYESPFFGQDVLKDIDGDGFAPMIYRKRLYGLRSDDRLTILSETGDTLAYQLLPSGEMEQTEPTPTNQQDATQTLSLIQTAENQLSEKRQILE